MSQSEEITEACAPETLESALANLDEWEDSYIAACRELRALVARVFSATSDDERLAALKEGLDAEYNLTGDCDLFEALANQFGLADAVDADRETSA